MLNKIISYFKNNTFTNFLLLATGSLLPLLCAKLNNGYLLVPLNQYYISIIIASAIDSFQIIQIEYIYSTAKLNTQKKLTATILNRQIGVSLILIPFIIIEFLIFHTGFLAIIYNKHIFNTARVGMVYGGEKGLISITLNYIGILRNILMSIAAFFFQLDIYFILSLVLISIIEVIIIWYFISKIYEVKINPSLIPNKDFKRLINKSLRSIRTYGISATSIVNACDRFLITVFDPLIQISYLTYKVVQQYIDGFFGIFAYELHVSQMKNKIFPTNKKIFILILSMTIFGFLSSFFLLKIETFYSAFIILLTCFMISFRRLLDGVLNANLRAFKKYYTAIYKSLIEVICTLVAFSISFILFPESADKIFMLYTIANILPIIYLLNHYKKN